MKRLFAAAVALALVGMVGLAWAAEKPDPSGTWKWTISFGGQDREMTLKLKWEKEKLAGALVVGDGQETPLQNGQFKDGNVSFTVVRERDGQKMTSKYAGKLEANAIKGKISFESDGESGSRDWEAKRAAAGGPTGTWKWTVSFGGQDREATLKLKLDGDKLTGAMLGRDNQETPIQDAKYKDGNIAFKVVRERNGQKMTSSYTGKLEGDAIKGKIESERDGQTTSRDWDAKRAKD